VGVSVPILAQARYSAPLIPFLSILACKALVPDRGASSDASCTFEEAATASC
jgi:hypothetical protein